MASTTSKTSHLLTLPSELLAQIYSLLFDSRVLTFPSANQEILDEGVGHKAGHQGGNQAANQPWPLTILLANHSISASARSALRYAIRHSTLVLVGITLDHADLKLLNSTTTGISVKQDYPSNPLLYHRQMLRLFLHHYTDCITSIHFKSLPYEPLSFTTFPNLKQLHFEHVSDLEGYHPGNDPQNLYDLAHRAGSSVAEIKAASLASWKRIQAWLIKYPSWYTMYSSGVLAHHDFLEMLKTDKGPRRQVDVYLHFDYRCYRRSIMSLMWKFGDRPLESDGIEILDVKRDYILNANCTI